MGFALKKFRNTWAQHLLLTCSLIGQHVWFKRCAAVCMLLCGKRGAHKGGSPYIFAIIPTPNSLQKKMKTKLRGILKGVHSAS